MDLEQHWRAIYGQARNALDAANLDDVPIVHVHSEDGPLSASVDPPFVAYRDETLSSIGSVAGGTLKVLVSNWVFSCYAVDLTEALACASAVASIVDNAFTTVDGYTTTGIDPVGLQSIYESDSKLYAVHLRLRWERST